MVAPFLSTSLQFSLRIRDQKGQLYKMRLDPKNLDKMKASPIYSEYEESIKVRLYGTGNDIQTINKIFLGLTTQHVKCTRLPSELHLKMDSSDSSIMKTKIDLVAKGADGFYRIRIKPENLQDCYAKFYPAKESAKKSIVCLRSSEGLMGSNAAQLRILFAQNQIAVYTEKGSEKSPSIVIRSNNPTMKVDKIPLVISWTGPVGNAKELACAVQAGSTDGNLLKIAERMIQLFGNITFPQVEVIREITELVPILPASAFRSVIIRAFDTIRQESDSGVRTEWPHEDWLNPRLLSSWTTLIEKLLLTKYRKGSTEINDEFFSVLQSSSMLRIVRHLEHLLFERRRDSEEVCCIYRKALWTFLQLARLVKGKEFDENKLDHLFKLATRKEEIRPILNINYIANCAAQELLISPTHRFDFEAIIESLGTDNDFDTSIHLTAPSLSPIANWYVSLCLFRCLLVRNKQSTFLDLLKQFEDYPQKFNQAFQYTNPVFLKGIMDMLNEIISYPQMHSNMAIEAFQLLRNIALHNSKQIGVWTSKIEDYKKQLAVLALQYAYNCVIHPNSEVRNHAYAVELDKRMPDLMPKTPRPFVDNLSVTLFTEIVKYETIHRISPRYRTIYSKPNKNWEFPKNHIPIYGVSKGQKDPINIIEILEKFIADPKARVATLQGRAGSGKTSIADRIAWQSCHQYMSKFHTKHQIFYIDLTTLKDPLGHMVSESLKACIDTESFEEYARLEKQPFVLFLDGYERLEIPNNGIPNLLETNKDEILCYPQAKFVFIHRTDFPFKPLGEFTSIEMTPFNKEQIYSYIWHHFQQQDDDIKDQFYYQTLCALEVLLEYENNGLMELLSNPLSLEATVQMMPYLVENLRILYIKKIKAVNFEGESLKARLSSMKNELESEMLKALVCMLARREMRRLSNRILFRPDEFFKFQIKYAENASRTTLPLIDKEKIALGLELKKEVEIRALFEACLEEREGKWRFRFAIIEQYFKTISQLSPEKQSEILEQFAKFITDDEYSLIWLAENGIG